MIRRILGGEYTVTSENTISDWDHYYSTAKLSTGAPSVHLAVDTEGYISLTMFQAIDAVTVLQDLIAVIEESYGQKIQPTPIQSEHGSGIL